MESVSIRNLRRVRCLPAIGFALACVFCGPAHAAASGSDGTRTETTFLAHDTTGDFAARHLRDDLLDEVFANFSLFIYVDKAQSGPLAQRMFVFDRTDDGGLALLYDWPVSTGRDRYELDAVGHVQSTHTPSGFFELDPKRMFEDHVSGEWNEAMPYAMFFDWKPNGRQTGLAIHGTPDENLDELGRAASAGCIRLSVDHAQTLFDLIQAQGLRLAPKLAYLDGSDGVSSEGLLLHDQAGNREMAENYSVLVRIDDFSGDDQIASLL
jgi:L,D-transpeptidase-like protein